jgi:hypothetical protein
MAIGGNDLVDYYMQLERRVARLERTSSVSNSQSDTTYVGTLSITGLTVQSQQVVAYGSDFQVYINFSWNALSIDPNVITDDPFIGYYTSFTKNGTDYTAENFTTDTNAMVGPLAQGQTITFRVRAVTQKNTFGAYASTSATTTLDNAAPGQPSTPTAAPYLGQVRLFWDGKQVGGSAMPTDLVVTEIHMSTTTITFTPTTATLVDTYYPGGGFTTITDLPYGVTHYFRLVAVDKVGNRSVVSTGVSVVPVQAADGDIAALNVGKLVAGTLSADITVAARIKTANTGARVELNSSGLQAYNSGGTQTVNVDAATGSAMFAGTFKTGLSGQRIEIDSSGNGTIYFYPAIGTDYAFINAPSQNSAGMNSGLAGTGKGTRFYATPTLAEMIYLSQPGQVQQGGRVAVDTGGVGIGGLVGDAVSISIVSGGRIDVTTSVDATGSSGVSTTTTSGTALFGAANGRYVQCVSTGDTTVSGGAGHATLIANNSRYIDLDPAGDVVWTCGGSTYISQTTTTINLQCTALKVPFMPTTANSPNMFLLSTSGQIYYNNSSKDIKTKIKNVDTKEVLRGLRALKPREFYDRRDWEEHKKTGSPVHPMVGLISEEVAEIGGTFAELFLTQSYDAEGNALPPGVDYSRLAVYLVTWLRDIEGRLESLAA